jgi:hypothetical protein
MINFERFVFNNNILHNIMLAAQMMMIQIHQKI